MPANKIEVLKSARDGLDVLPDLHRYAALAAAGENPQIPADDFERLKWYGLFHRKRTPGYFMLRLRIPGGALTSEQIVAIGEIANRVGRGQADITTRMNIQLRWITIADAPWVLQRLSAVGLTTQQSGMDNIRNIVSCPLSGLTEDELIDTRVLTERMQRAIIGGKRFSNLPRKFNLSVTGCREDCSHAQVHDLSFAPAQRGAEIGFNLLVGGALGGMSPEYAQPLDVFAGVDAAVDLAVATLEVFRDHGLREKRKQSRLKWLIREWGIERFREAVEAQMGLPLDRAGEALTTRHGGDHIGITKQRVPGLRTVGCLVPVGRVTGDDLIDFGRLAKQYGNGEVRLTVQQNVLIPNVSEDRLDQLLNEPLLQRYSPTPSAFVRAMVSCTGNDFCAFALIDSKGEAIKLASALEERFDVAEGSAPVRIQMSACPHACGQHRAAEIGVLGGRKRVDGQIVEVGDIFAGGRLGEDPVLGEVVAPAVRTSELADAVAEQIRAVRGPGALISRSALEPLD
jgi:ferredoxin-nitrite reductase